MFSYWNLRFIERLKVSKSTILTSFILNISFPAFSSKWIVPVVPYKKLEEGFCESMIFSSTLFMCRLLFIYLITVSIIQMLRSFFQGRQRLVYYILLPFFILHKLWLLFYPSIHHLVFHFSFSLYCTLGSKSHLERFPLYSSNLTLHL